MGAGTSVRAQPNCVARSVGSLPERSSLPRLAAALALGELPPASVLAAAVLRPQLAPRVAREKLARVEPVLRHGVRQDGPELAAKRTDGGAPVVPQRQPVG